MGDNEEIRKRMETYRKILLAIEWIVAGIGLFSGFMMMNSYYTYSRTIGIALIIGSIIYGIISHFLVNVALAIPFILLNNGDILATLAGNGKITGNEENTYRGESDIAIDDKWKCSKCGNINDVYLLYCKKCGKEFYEEK